MNRGALRCHLVINFEAVGGLSPPGLTAVVFIDRSLSMAERENQLSMAQIDNNSSQQLHQRFHSNHGSLVQLSENRLSAFRLRPSHEFNQGLVFSSQPLKDDQLFEVKIDRKVSLIS